MKVIVEKPWDYVIESRGEEYKAIILGGTSAIFNTEVRLSSDEIHLLKQDKNNADLIIEKIKKDKSRMSKQ